MSFHVPERYRLKNHPVLGTSSLDGNNGCFLIQSCVKGWILCLICSDGIGWEHVSIHAEKHGHRTQRVPTWEEMCHVKATCWDGEDVVMQLHPRESEYVNNHSFTLHLWRPTDREIPTPPSATVGIKSKGVLSDEVSRAEAEQIYQSCNNELAARLQPSETPKEDV